MLLKFGPSSDRVREYLRRFDKPDEEQRVSSFEASSSCEPKSTCSDLSRLSHDQLVDLFRKRRRDEQTADEFLSQHNS